MKRLVLIGEGQGECSALPLLAKKVLNEKDPSHQLVVDDEVVRVGNAAGLLKWDKEKNQTNSEEWVKRVRLAARRPRMGAVLAVFDGDLPHFPAGSKTPFCAATAAKALARAAADAGAGRMFPLAVVFACVEYETWIIAGVESLAGKSFEGGRPALPAGTAFPEGDPEAHGKGWLAKHMPGYRETRDQGPLTRMLDLRVVRAKGLRSFQRLEHAIDQLLAAVMEERFSSTP